MAKRTTSTTSRYEITPKKLRGPDWAMSSAMLQCSFDAIYAQVKVMRCYNVPYVAGYSVDGKTIYIDKDLPHTLQVRNRENGNKPRRMYIDRYLIMHEATEKSLMRSYGLYYQHAHQVALRIESELVRADGFMWQDYDRQLKPYIKLAEEDLVDDLPPDLDLTPYEDELDWELVSTMQKAMLATRIRAAARRK
jgi:hypothetical protein